MSLPIILTTIGVLIILKSLWVIAVPTTVRNLVLRFCKDDGSIRQVGCVMLMVGIALLVVAVLLR